MRRIVGAVFFSLALTVAAAASDAVVVDGAASRDGLAPGSVFSAGETITLLPGERLHVLLRSGRLVEVVGPFSGRVAAAAAPRGADGGALDTVSALVLGRRGTRTVLGASRESAMVPVVPPDVWLIATDASGVRCVDGPPRLWRRDTSSAADVAAHGAAGRSGPLTWPAGEATLALPADLAAPGPLVVTIGEVVRRFELRPVPPGRDLADPGRLLLWFAEAGCVHQARLLLDRLRAP
jgi:hypothetical protein